jgi:hypothetical protein
MWMLGIPTGEPATTITTETRPDDSESAGLARDVDDVSDSDDNDGSHLLKNNAMM